jgi:IS4 transposase
VSRLKKNAIIRIVQAFSLPEDSKVLSDEWYTSVRHKNEWRTSYAWIHAVDSEGNILAIITNRFDLEADEVSEMYRERWAIETFFKWMKNATPVAFIFMIIYDQTS